LDKFLDRIFGVAPEEEHSHVYGLIESTAEFKNSATMELMCKREMFRTKRFSTHGIVVENVVEQQEVQGVCSLAKAD
jgi:hypothetical protein